MRLKAPTLATILISTATLVVFFAARSSSKTFTVKAYFADAQGLLPNAPVRLAGVDVGRVASVRVRDDLREKPAEAVLRIQVNYPLHIPADAVVHLASAGVLGETYAEIDIRNATGPPIENGGVLKTLETDRSRDSKALLECLANLAEQKPCQLDGNGGVVGGKDTAPRSKDAATRGKDPGPPTQPPVR